MVDLVEKELQSVASEYDIQMNVVKKPISIWSTESSGKLPFLSPNVLGINYRNRLGALEVQMYAKWQGKSSQHILHSKLLSGRWPNLSVVTDISHAIFKNLMNHGIMDKSNSLNFADNYLNIDGSLLLDTTTTAPCNVNSPEQLAVKEDKLSIMVEETTNLFNALDTEGPLCLASLENLEDHNLKSTLSYDSYNSVAISASENKNIVNNINISKKELETSFTLSHEELNSNGYFEEGLTTIIHDDKSIISRDLKTPIQIDPASKYKNIEDSNIKNQQKQEIITSLVSESIICLLYTSPSPRDRTRSRMPSSA